MNAPGGDLVESTSWLVWGLDQGSPWYYAWKSKQTPVGPECRVLWIHSPRALPRSQARALPADVTAASTLALVLPSLLSTLASAWAQSSLPLPAPVLVHTVGAATAPFLERSSHLATPRLPNPPWLPHLQNRVRIPGAPRCRLCRPRLHKRPECQHSRRSRGCCRRVWTARPHCLGSNPRAGGSPLLFREGYREHV